MTGGQQHIGIVLFEDAEEIDAVGPWEVLSYWTRNHPGNGYNVTCLSRSGGLVQSAPMALFERGRVVV